MSLKTTRPHCSSRGVPIGVLKVKYWTGSGRSQGDPALDDRRVDRLDRQLAGDEVELAEGPASRRR
jgi:hypothetical protein